MLALNLVKIFYTSPGQLYGSRNMEKLCIRPTYNIPLFCREQDKLYQGFHIWNKHTYIIRTPENRLNHLDGHTLWIISSLLSDFCKPRTLVVKEAELQDLYTVLEFTKNSSNVNKQEVVAWCARLMLQHHNPGTFSTLPPVHFQVIP